MRLFLGIYLSLSAALLLGDSFIFAQGVQQKQTSAILSEANIGPKVSLGSNPASSSQIKGPAGENTPAETASVMQIQRLETAAPLYSFELRNTDIGDLLKVLAHDYKLNLLIDKDVQGTITASLSQVSLEDALQAIAESQNLILEKKGNIIKVRPNLVTKIFTLKYIEAKNILESSSNSTAEITTESQTPPPASPQTTSTESPESQSGAASIRQASVIYDLLSDKGKALLGRQHNSIIIIDYPPNIEKVEEYIKVIDQKMASLVFKLKYLRAADIVGETGTGSTATEASSGSSSNTSASAASASGGSQSK